MPNSPSVLVRTGAQPVADARFGKGGGAQSSAAAYRSGCRICSVDTGGLA